MRPGRLRLAHAPVIAAAIVVLALTTSPAFAVPPTPSPSPSPTVVRPANDDFAGAMSIAGTSGSVTVSTTNASTEAGEPNADQGGTVWLRWTAPSSGWIEFSSHSLWTNALFGYTGSSLGALNSVLAGCTSETQRGMNDVGDDGYLDATAGTTYSLQLAWLKGNPGDTVTLDWQPWSHPTNDDVADAIGLKGFDTTVHSNNCVMSTEPGEPIQSYGAASTVWYRWTPTATVDEEISIDDDFDVHVWTGTPMTSLTQVTANDWQSVPSHFRAHAGKVYWLQVDGKSGRGVPGGPGWQGYFTLSLHHSYLYYDQFAMPLSVGIWPNDLDRTAMSDNIDATKESGEPDHAGVVGGSSMWFSYSTPATGTLEIDTDGSQFDTVLGVYTGSSLGSLHQVAADNNSGTGTASRVVFTARRDVVYKIAVDGVGGAQGQIYLHHHITVPRPANDNFANAFVFDKTIGTVRRSYTFSATRQAGEPKLSTDASGHTVWWRYVAPHDGRLVLHDTNTELLAAYSGGSVSTLHRLAVTKFGDMWFKVRKGHAYSIAADYLTRAWPGRSQFSYALYPYPPANDSPASAMALTGSRGTVYGTTVGAEASYDGAPTSIYYRWKAPSTGWFMWSTAHSDVAAQLSVSAVTAGKTVYGDTDEVTEDPRVDYAYEPTGRVPIRVTAGVVYRIIVTTDADGQGPTRLDWRPISWGPANDMFDHPQAITGATGSVTGTVVRSTIEPGEPGESTTLFSDSVWFSWTAPVTGPVSFWTDDSALTASVGVYTGNTLSGLTTLGESGQRTGNQGGRVDISATAGASYRIRVGSQSQGSRGAVRLSWGTPGAPPANDDYAAAVTLTGDHGSVDGTTRWASYQAGEYDRFIDTGTKPATVWYQWQAPTTGVVSFWMSGHGHGYPSVTLLQCSGVSSCRQAQNAVPLQAQQFDDDYRTNVGVAAGTVYQIQVAGEYGLGAAFTMRWTELPPPNDDLANAVTLTGTDGSYGGDDWDTFTLRATGEPGEPSSAVGPTQSIWFRWTAPIDGRVRFVDDGDFDQYLQFDAYTGASIATLTPVATRGEYDEQLVFSAVAGRSYLLRINSPDFAGQQHLRWRMQHDTAAPYGTVAINGGAPGTTHRLVTLNLSAHDDNRVAYVFIADRPFARPDRDALLADQPWFDQYVARLQGNPSSLTWSLTDRNFGGDLGPGRKTVYVMWEDAAGNLSPVVHATIQASLPAVGDYLPPTLLGVVFPGAGLPTSANVVVGAWAKELWTGLAYVRLSNSPKTSHGLLEYAAVRPYGSGHWSWSLTDSRYGGTAGSGRKCVYAQLRDGAGNWTRVGSACTTLS